ncbi:uncharacterized protein LOC126576575 [Anopheles aquasalis]|uniref:uncharacterized protein LOC126576575 n=1 Tax=Anopheles aquasalis TaxID=42839 RepID=UPI00215A3C3A|nr:uncharacterized protein LOC126576575 [Anopheles aquasalis]
MVPVTLRNGTNEMSALTFLDCGSSLTLIDEEAADRLGLGGYHDPLTMKWTHDISRQEEESRRVKVTVQCTDGHPYVLKGVRTVKTLQLPAQGLDMATLQKYPHLRDVPLTAYDRARPTILIGLGHGHLLMGLDRRMGAPNEPMAVRTKLGWVVFGTEQVKTGSEDHTMVHEEAEMNEMIARYFTTEDFGVKAAPAVESEDVATAKKTIESTLVRRGDSFEVGLLWRSNRVRFPDSYQNAVHRLEGLERKLGKRPDLQAWALRTFQEYVEKGYIRKLTPSELLREDVFYVPHFIVEGKKPRIVFDAAAQVRGVSLNSQLLPGPDNLTPLFGVLVRCREQRIAVAGDIQEMFHRVKLRESDQHFQRVLWRDCEPGRDPDVYVVQVLTFGATCSPSCAQAAKNRNAEELADRYPLAKDAIQRQHYVDDYIDSFASLATATETVAQVIQAHDEGGFRIRNFISSSKELLAWIPEDRRSSGAQLMLEEKAASYERILGVFWDTSTDKFGFWTNYQKADPATKREALSFVMSLYDPLGLASHVTIQGRVLMREVHVATEEWDEPIPDRLCARWEAFVRQLEALKDEAVEVQRLATVNPPFEKRFSVADFDEARRAMYRKAQQDVYAKDIAAIRRQGHVDKGSSVASLNPFLDDYGVMRVRGRLENATALDRAARIPVMLPQKHKITELLVRDYHERGPHQGDNVVVGMVHERFWVVNLRAHRRGKVRHLYSDNGTNFVGAEAELRRLVADVNTKMGAMVATEMEMERHFNSPAAPHFGGVWERQTQTVKKALRHDARGMVLAETNGGFF